MGAIGSGKTTTGVQIALALASQARIPFLFIDPKGEFVADGRPIGPFAGHANVGEMEAGTDPVPLDFLPRADTAPMKIARAAMRLRDTLVLCCKAPGDLQKDILRTAIEHVIKNGSDRNLETIRETYEQELHANGKENDRIVSRLNELTHLRCFEAKLQPAQFFSQWWVVNLKGLPEELKRLFTLVLLDAVSAFLSKLRLGVLWNASTRTMILKNGKLSVALFLYLAGQRTGNEGYNLQEQYRKALGDEKAKLPPVG